MALVSGAKTKIKLLATGSRFEVGRTVELAVGVELPAPQSLELWVEFCESGDSRERQRVFSGPLGAGMTRVPIAVNVPRGPATFFGKLVSVAWTLHAEARGIGLKKVTDELPVELIGGDLIETPNVALDEAKTSDDEFGFRLGTAWSIIGFLAVGYVTFASIVGIQIGVVGYVLLGGASTLAMVAFAGRRRLARTFSDKLAGSVDARVSTHFASQGDTVEVEVFARSRAQVVPDRVLIELIVEEQRDTTTKNRAERERELLYRVRRAPVPDASRSHWRVSVGFELPHSAPPSYARKHHRIVWRVAIRAEIPRAPDWYRDLPLSVSASPTLQLEEEQNPVAG